MDAIAVAVNTLLDIVKRLALLTSILHSSRVTEYQYHIKFAAIPVAVISLLSMVRLLPVLMSTEPSLPRNNEVRHVVPTFILDNLTALLEIEKVLLPLVTMVESFKKTASKYVLVVTVTSATSMTLSLTEMILLPEMVNATVE